MCEIWPLLVSLCAPPLHLTPPSCQSPMAGPFSSPPPTPTPTPAIWSWRRASNTRGIMDARRALYITRESIYGPWNYLGSFALNLNRGCSLYVPLRSNFQVACIHNFGNLKGVDRQSMPVLGPKITKANWVWFGPKTDDSCWSIPIKGTVAWDFLLPIFFYKFVVPSPLIHILKYLPIICCVLLSYRP